MKTDEQVKRKLKRTQKKIHKLYDCGFQDTYDHGFLVGLIDGILWIRRKN